MLEMDFPRFKDVNIAEAFEKIKNSMFERYRGALIMKKLNPATNTDSYYWNNQWFDDLALAKMAVDDAIKGLSESVKISMTVIKKDGTEIQVGKEHIDGIFYGCSPFESFKKSQPPDNTAP